MSLDTQYQLTTPEGVLLNLHPAGHLVRTKAFLWDFFLRSIIYIALGIVLSFAGEVGFGFFLLASFIIEWFYPIYFEVISNGATPGKKRYGLRVINEDGTPIHLSASVVRNLIRFVDFLPTFYASAYVSMVLTEKFQRLGDLAAGSLVVYTNEKVTVTPIEATQSLSSPVPLTDAERKAIVRFAESASTLSQARQEELANILQPILGVSDRQAVQKIHAMAKNIVSS